MAHIGVRLPFTPPIYTHQHTGVYMSVTIIRNPIITDIVLSCGLDDDKCPDTEPMEEAPPTLPYGYEHVEEKG